MSCLSEVKEKGRGGVRGGSLFKIKLVEEWMKGKGKKWRKSSAVLLIDSPLPISQD